MDSQDVFRSLPPHHSFQSGAAVSLPPVSDSQNPWVEAPGEQQSLFNDVAGAPPQRSASSSHDPFAGGASGASGGPISAGDGRVEAAMRLMASGGGGGARERGGGRGGTEGRGGPAVMRASVDDLHKQRFVLYFDSEDPAAAENREIVLSWLGTNPSISHFVTRQDLKQWRNENPGRDIFAENPWLRHHPLIVDTESKHVRPGQKHVVFFPQFMSYLREECMIAGENRLSVNDIRPHGMPRHRCQRKAMQGGVVSQLKHVNHKGGGIEAYSSSSDIFPPQ